MARSAKSYEERMLRLEKKEQGKAESKRYAAETGTENVRKMWKLKKADTQALPDLVMQWNQC